MPIIILLNTHQIQIYLLLYIHQKKYFYYFLYTTHINSYYHFFDFLVLYCLFFYVLVF